MPSRYYDKHEMNTHLAYILQQWWDRPARPEEVKDVILLATYYQARARKNQRHIAMAEKNQVWCGIYHAIVHQKRDRKIFYGVLELFLGELKRKGYIVEPQDGWLDITEAGKIYLTAKSNASMFFSRRVINYIATYSDKNRSRNRQKLNRYRKIIDT